MAADRNVPWGIDRRRFVTSALVPVVAPLSAALLTSRTRSEETPADEPAEVNNAPPIIDTNVHLFKWPFRNLKYDSTSALLAKLRKHRVTKAWAGSFEAVLSKQLDRINARLAKECIHNGDGLLVPIGSVNPIWPDWEEDLRRCHETHRMPGVRLYPTYHHYTLDDPQVARLLALAADRKMFVQIVLRLEDERVHHPALMAEPVDVAPLVDALKHAPAAKVQLLNSAGPLLGKSVSQLVRDTQVRFDISAIEGNGGIGKVVQGKNPNTQGAIPVERLLFGSHAPFFPLEAALLRLFESPLQLDALTKIMNANSTQFLG